MNLSNDNETRHNACKLASKPDAVLPVLAVTATRTMFTESMSAIQNIEYIVKHLFTLRI